tara:strand:- start:58 stop:309 length:252 start_codon:yes stop_codon:yes gene_type:complete
MSHNIHQIIDGIVDQITDVQARITQHQQDIVDSQAAIPLLEQELVVLEGMKTTAEGLNQGNGVNVTINNFGSSGSSVPNLPNI